MLRTPIEIVPDQPSDKSTYSVLLLGSVVSFSDANAVAFVADGLILLGSHGLAAVVGDVTGVMGSQWGLGHTLLPHNLLVLVNWWSKIEVEVEHWLLWLLVLRLASEWSDGQLEASGCLRGLKLLLIIGRGRMRGSNRQERGEQTWLSCSKRTSEGTKACGWLLNS